MIAALQLGEADALVVETVNGPKVYTLHSADEPYRTIVERMQEGAVTVSHDGVVLYCNDAFSCLVGRDSSTLIGRSLGEVMGAGILADISGGGGARSVERSLPRSDGSRRECLISSVPHDGDGEIVWCLLITDLTAQTLRVRHNAIVESTDDAIMSFNCAGHITTWNPAAETLFGYTAAEAIGVHADLLVKPLGCVGEDAAHLRGFDAALSGRNFREDTQLIAKDGKAIDVSVTASPLRGPDETVIGGAAIMRDIAESKRAEERERLLMREVNHRAKNMLGLVQAIARQTAAHNPKDFVDRFANRIQALSASQDLLVKSGWRNVPLEALVRAQLGHFVDLIGSRILLAGNSLEITAAAAQAVGLSIHELATNAAKYGALANHTGLVTVTWGVEADGSERRFTLSWVETGGPPVVEPRRRGFGSTITGNLVKMSLDGDVQTEFRPAGLRWRVSCCADNIVAGAGRIPQRRINDEAFEDDQTDGRRILVVEDEPLIATEVATLLKEAGFTVLGPVGTVAEALLLLNKGRCDGAVLDVSLGNMTAERVALNLLSTSTPFVTISAFSRDQVPAAFKTAPLVGKPIQPDRLLRELQQGLEN